MIIGLTGAAGAGKDTVADILVDEHGFKRIGFADALRKMARDIDPVIATEPTWEPDSDIPTGIRFLRLDEAIDAYGYEHVKRTYPEARRFLQRLGTEGIRVNVDDSFWVRRVLNTIDADLDTNWVVTDCRFINEASGLLDIGGVIVRVDRKDVAPLPGAHASEAGVPGHLVQYVLPNDETIEDLASRVDVLVRYISLYDLGNQEDPTYVQGS